jgi:lysozyme
MSRTWIVLTASFVLAAALGSCMTLKKTAPPPTQASVSPRTAAPPTAAAPPAATQKSATPKAATPKAAAAPPAAASAARKPAEQKQAALPPASRPPAASTSMHTNTAGLAIIKDSEGHNLKPYQDGGHWYVGYGHSVKGPGPAISEAEAERLLRQDLSVCEGKVDEAVDPAMSSNEFSAMVSLCYNIGWGNFTKSSVVAKLNKEDRPGAAEAFLPFTKATVGGVRQELPRLRARREKERALFLAPDQPEGA